jgi:hypothetical protein
LYVEHCGKIYLQKILRNIVCWALWEDYLHKILGITLCWTLREDLFTQNTEEYFMLNTVGRFIYTKYWGILLVEQWEYLFTHDTEEYYMLSTTVGRFICTKYWGLLCVAHCVKIYLHKILRNTLCLTLWEDLFTQNTGKYFMLTTVGRFIYT